MMANHLRVQYTNFFMNAGCIFVQNLAYSKVREIVRCRAVFGELRLTTSLLALWLVNLTPDQENMSLNPWRDLTCTLTEGGRPLGSGPQFFSFQGDEVPAF